MAPVLDVAPVFITFAVLALACFGCDARNVWRARKERNASHAPGIPLWLGVSLDGDPPRSRGARDAAGDIEMTGDASASDALAGGVAQANDARVSSSIAPSAASGPHCCTTASAYRGGVCDLRMAGGKCLAAFCVAYFAVVIVFIIVLASHALDSMWFVPLPASECLTVEEAAANPCPSSDRWRCCELDAEGQYSPYTAPGLAYERVTIENPTLPSSPIDAWLMVSDPATTPTPPVPVLYSHGQAGNLGVGSQVEVYDWLLSLGVVVLAYDYPGYGFTPGTPTQDSAYATSEAAFDYLKDRVAARADANVTADFMLVYGHSLGSLISTHLPGVREVDAMMIRQGWGDGYQIIDFSAPMVSPFLPYVSGYFDNTAAVEGFDKCLMLTAAAEDTVVPYELSQGLWAMAIDKDQTCSAFVTTGGNHRDEPHDEAKEAIAPWIEAQRARMVAQAAERAAR